MARTRIAQRWRPDLVAVVALLALAGFWLYLSWGRLHDPIQDQGWYLQVAARVAAGEVLYRDVIWMYGPLPVYLLAALFRWMRTDVAMLFVVYYTLAVLGCLLSYWVARFLLSPALAWLGTAVVFLGGWWGGFPSYTLAYTAAVPLGAVFGLCFVGCLLSYQRSRQTLWVIAAGFCTGGALLTKPEFAVATLGTGVIILGAAAAVPPDPGSNRAAAVRALATYLLVAAGIAALGYGVLARLAEWPDIWAGISGYDQDLIMLREWPPWGTTLSWYYIASGLGVYLLLVASLVAFLPATASRRDRVLAASLAALGAALALLPWAPILSTQPSLRALMLTSRTALFEQAIRVLWAPASLITAVALGLLGVRWYRAAHRRQTLSPLEAHMAVLILYSALANLRSFLHPLGTLHFHYVHTLFPVLLYGLAHLVPRAAERWGRSPVRSGWAMPLLVALLGVYALAGLDWDLAHLAQIDTLLASPRGRAYYFADSFRRRPWADLLLYIESHTQPGDSIVILGPEPGFYFWSGRANPLRQDMVLPGMSASRADAEEIARRIQADCPALVIVPRSVEQGNVWLWNLEIGRKAYQDLQPVWQYIQGYYQLRTLLGGREWGYSIYEPGNCASRASGSSRSGSMFGSGLQAWRRPAPVSHMSVKTLVCGV